MRKQNLLKSWSELKHAMENSFPYLEKEKKLNSESAILFS